MKDRAGLLASMLFAACTPNADVDPEPCRAGTIATVGGCAPLPSWEKSDVPDASAPDAEADPDAGFDAGEVDAGEPPPFAPSGAWAMRVVNVQAVQSELAGPEQVTFIGLSLVTIDDALRPSSSLCSLESSPFAQTTTTWPTAAITSGILIGESATVGGLGMGSFTMGRTQLLGWRSEDASAPLPEDRDDVRVYDADGDGQPGVTLEVTGAIDGRMYVVSRARLSLQGAVVASDRIEGGSRTEQDQAVLEATNDVLLFNQTTAQPIAELSRFEMVRLPEAIDCERLVQTADVLFMDP